MLLHLLHLGPFLLCWDFHWDVWCRRQCVGVRMSSSCDRSQTEYVWFPLTQGNNLKDKTLVESWGPSNSKRCGRALATALQIWSVCCNCFPSTLHKVTEAFFFRASQHAGCFIAIESFHIWNDSYEMHKAAELAAVLSSDLIVRNRPQKLRGADNSCTVFLQHKPSCGSLH